MIEMHLGSIDSALPFLERAIATDRNYSLKAAADGDFEKHSDKLRAFLDECRSRAREKSQRVVLLALLEVVIMKRWRAREADFAQYDKSIANLRWAQECLAHQTFYGYLDATPKASSAIVAAKKATQAQQALLAKMANDLSAKVSIIRARIRTEAQEHAPSAWAEAEKEADRIAHLDAPATNYEEYKDKINRMCPALSLMEKAEQLTRQRANESGRISAYNKSLLDKAAEDASICALIVFAVAGIGGWIWLIMRRQSQQDMGERILAVLLGWIPGGIIGIVCAGAAWLLMYLAIHAGAGQKPHPPKN